MKNRKQELEKRLEDLKERGIQPEELIRVAFTDVQYLVSENKELHKRILELVKKSGSTKEDEDKATLVKYFNENPNLLKIFNKVMQKTSAQ